MWSAATRRTGVLILAAGASSRLGQAKQLLSWNGESLIRRVGRIATEAECAPVIVVLGAQAERIRPALDGLPVTIVVNDAWEEGMASTIRAGIAALDSADIDAVLLLLCDQPLVTSDVLRRLADAVVHGKAAAAVSVYEDGVPGAPCCFRRALFPELSALRGAHGAKQVFSRLPESALARVPFAEGAHDIDTPEDWASLNRAG